LTIPRAVCNETGALFKCAAAMEQVEASNELESTHQTGSYGEPSGGASASASA